MTVEFSSVLLYLAIFLMAAKLGALLAAKLKQPGVFGELLVGILIGPSIAGWISKQLGLPPLVEPASDAGAFIGVFADIGIILLLFLAGLSIDVDQLKAAGRTATCVAISGVLMAFGLGFGVASLCGWSSLQAAFVGAVLAATSVGITVRTLMDIHQLHTRVGMTILGAAVLDDIIGIFILAALAGISLGGFSLGGFGKLAGLVAIFLMLSIYIGFKVMPRLLMRAAKLPVEEMTLSVALAFVFLMSMFAEKVELAAITGAFVAGIVLSRAPVADTLTNKLSTIGYGLFIPLFFVGMGVRTDLRALWGVSILALGIVGVAIFDKVAGCGIGALIGGFGPHDSVRIGVGMMPRAEVALIIASFGAKAGIVTSELFSITVMVVLVTSLLSPVMIRLAFRGRAA